MECERARALARSGPVVTSRLLDQAARRRRRSARPRTAARPKRPAVPVPCAPRRETVQPLSSVLVPEPVPVPESATEPELDDEDELDELVPASAGEAGFPQAPFVHDPLVHWSADVQGLPSSTFALQILAVVSQ